MGRFVYRSTHTAELIRIPASGTAVELRSIDVWRVADGIFVEHWDELNLLQMFQQMAPHRHCAPARRPSRDTAPQLAALVANVSSGVAYGTDAFSALVQRPATARVDDATLTATMGNQHRYGDRRMPAPGILGLQTLPTAGSTPTPVRGRARSSAPMQR